MVKAPFVQIGDCANVLNGFAFRSELFTTERKGLPVVRIRDVTRGRTETYYTGAYPDSAVIRNGDLLVGMDGEFNIARWQGGTALLNQRVCKIEAKAGVSDIEYLRHALANVLKRIEHRTPFVTVKHLSSEELKEEIVLLPDLLEQQRIAERLEQSDRLRRKRRYALELTDNFLPAVFIAMFGDPLQNTHDYKVEELGDLLLIPPGLGTTKPCERDGALRCVRVGEIGLGEIDLENCGFVNLTESERSRFVAEAGDILLARAIGSEEHLGKLSICRPHTGVLTFDSHVMRLRVDPSRLLPQFLASMLWSPGGRRLFMRQARRTAVQFNINAEQISSLPIPLPALPKQQQFVALVEQGDSLRAVQQEALRQAEHLFASLLDRSFGS